jgi:multidrug resistance efflux pump
VTGMRALTKLLATGLVVAIAGGLVAYKYWSYLTNPWTRNGQVRAIVIQITPRVSGPIVDLPIVDNQYVEAGDVLFRIDPRTFQEAYDKALADIDNTRDALKSLEAQVDAAEASISSYEALVEEARSEVRGYEANFENTRVEFERAAELVERQVISQALFDQRRRDNEVAQAQLDRANSQLLQAQADLAQAQADLAETVAQLGAPGEDNAQLRAAMSDAESARLDLEFTEVKAPVDGFVTNLTVRLGSQAVANQPTLALVDANSFWLDGYFRESMIRNISRGNRAVITLMSYPDTPIEGRVDSIGWGIAQDDGSTSADLLPNVNPTFPWIRLAERIPVRVVVPEVPDGVELRVGATASIVVLTGTQENEGGDVPAAPLMLQ